MPEPKYTPDGLPIVSKETLTALNALAKRLDIVKFLDRVRNENPNLYEELEQIFSSDDKYPENFVQAFTTGFGFCYESLRRQAAANKLERELNGE